ncbi:hypothetical protein BpHYR1_047607 [Brachionus plicatilis]|uniref:Uncharacterized protein n=1 Tax=Brachionus plicatilis TaxID=10195 RepID=A0A3M7RSR8_BRAPC|nr:hypothetical protein BpHYR1_047607 [Brachionus plicatilis]
MSKTSSADEIKRNIFCFCRRLQNLQDWTFFKILLVKSFSIKIKEFQEPSHLTNSFVDYLFGINERDKCSK